VPLTPKYRCKRKKVYQMYQIALSQTHKTIDNKVHRPATIKCSKHHHKKCTKTTSTLTRKKPLLKINKWRYTKIAEKQRHSSHRAEARCIESDAGYEGPSGADFSQQDSDVGNETTNTPMPSQRSTAREKRKIKQKRRNLRTQFS
jgi:hypothetical protein